MSQSGGRTSSSCTPCNYKDAWATIRSRGIEAAPTKLLRGVEKQPVVDGRTATLESGVKGFFGVGDGGSPELETALTDLFNAMDAEYTSEELFSQELFLKIAKCFEQGGWEVECRETRKTTISAARVKRIPLRQRKDDSLPTTGIGKEEAEEGQRVVLENMVLLGRNKAAPLAQQSAGTATDRLETYVVQVGEWEYAMGLSRKVHMPGNESSIFSGESFPDHALALFKKRVETNAADVANEAAKKPATKSAKRKAKNDWIVDQILAAVELKMSDTACRRFDVESTKRSRGSDESSERVRVQCFREANYDRYGPLGQELTYVFGHVLWGRAALGLKLEPSLPMAVVAAKRSDKARPKDALCWFHGNLLVPEECGGRFRFNVDALGEFDEQGRSGREALAAYADVMQSGRKAAELWLASHASLRPPVPMCGRKLRFGSSDLIGMRLELSPVTKGDDQVDVPTPKDATPAVDATPKISQGELFAGEVDVALLRTRNPDSEDISWCNDASEAYRSNSVMVKVSSRACYNSLVGTEGFLSHHDTHKEVPSWSQVCRCLSPSLHAVYSTAKGFGLVQLMPDLTEQEFEPLCPESLKVDNQWNSMWQAFKAFVCDILIPLAEAKVIHPDLRPGYNCTANLLYNREKKEMRMIDLDSLVLFRTWSQSNPGDDRYILDRPDEFQGELMSALDFVFKQVVVITGAWIMGVHDGEADADAIFAESESGRAWIQNCQGDDIRRVLEAIEPHFAP